MIIITLIESSYYLKMMTYRRHCKMKMHIRIQSTALWIWWQCSVHGHKTTSIPHSYILLEKPTPGWDRHPSWGTVSPYNKYGGGGTGNQKPRDFLKFPVFYVGIIWYLAVPDGPRGKGNTQNSPAPGWHPLGGEHFLVPGYGISIHSLSTYSCHVEGENEGCIYSFRRTLSSRVLNDCKFELKNKKVRAIPGQLNF